MGIIGWTAMYQVGKKAAKKQQDKQDKKASECYTSPQAPVYQPGYQPQVNYPHGHPQYAASSKPQSGSI